MEPNLEEELRERISVLEGEYGRLNELYRLLRGRYIDNHQIWELTLKQNEELRAALHNLTES